MPNFLVGLSTVAVLALGIMGFAYLNTATETLTPEDARTPAMVSGVTCLILATGLLVFTFWTFRKDHNQSEK